MPRKAPPFNLAHTRIGLSISAATLVVVLSCVGILAFVSFHFLNEFGGISLHQYKEELIRQAYSRLSITARENGAVCSHSLAGAEDNIRLMSATAARLLGRSAEYGGRDLHPGENMSLNLANNIFTNGPDGPASAVYWDKPEMDQAARTSMNALSHLDPVLRHAVETTQGAIAAWIMTQSGMARYFPNINLVDVMPPVSEFDFREDICFLASTPERNPGKGPTWTNIYQDSAGQGLIISANMPSYDSSGTFLGSLGIDISVERFLGSVLDFEGASLWANRTMSESPNVPQGTFKFLVGADGAIIAFPMDRLPLFGIPLPKNLAPGELLGRNLMESPFQNVRDLTAKMAKGESGSMRLDLNGTALLAAFAPLNPTGWSLCAAVPESDVLSSTDDTKAALSTSILGMAQRYSLIAILLAILVPTAILALFSQRILTPLGVILDSVRDIGQGNLARRTGLRQKDELGELGREMDRMAESLAASRTSLAEAEKMYRAIFENAMEGLFQVLPGYPLEVTANPAMASMLGFDSPAELSKTAAEPGASMFFDPAHREVIIETLTKHGRIDAFEIQLKRRDGSPVWVLLSAKEIRDREGRLLRYEGFCLDIDEKIKAREKVLNHSRELIKTGEAERRRIALELHDSVGQDLSALRLCFEGAVNESLSREEREKQTELSRTVLSKAIKEVRDLAYELRPSALEEMGLVRALESWLDTIRTPGGPGIEFSASGLRAVRFGFDAEINLFRIVQEFVNNSLKHAQAGRISIRMVASHPDVIIRMEDDGVGFDCDSRPLEALKERSMGLWNMSERTKLLGGEFHLASKPGRGVRVKVEVPLMDRIAPRQS